MVIERITVAANVIPPTVIVVAALVVKRIMRKIVLIG